MKEKRSLIPRGCSVPSLEMRRISCLLRLPLLPEMRQRARSNFHVRNAMTAGIKMSGNTLVSIVGSNCATMLTELVLNCLPVSPM